MRIIIAPAKQMMEDREEPTPQGLPVFLPRAEEIMHWMQGLSYAEAKKLWACNDKLAARNFERFANMDLYHDLTPAILAYDGIAYKYMAPNVFEYGQFDYVQEHLRILSGFYGVLKPMDGVTPYRLEMQAKAKIAGTKDLYEYWGDTIYKEVVGTAGITADSSGSHTNTEDHSEESAVNHAGTVSDSVNKSEENPGRIIINLASKEYSRCIESYLTPADTFITCIFGEPVNGKIVQKGVYAKMARGDMVRFMAENNVQRPEELRGYDRLGYHFSEKDSDERTYTFLR